jgi:hypothetical protein
MKKSILLSLITILILSFGSQIMAKKKAPQKPFTAKELKNFLATWPGFAKLTKESGQELDQIEDPSVWNVMNFSAKIVKYLKKKGWRPERFAYVLSHVVYGLYLSEMNNLMPGVISQLEAQKEAIANNPGLSDTQKQQMLAQMETASKQAKNTKQEHKHELPASELKLIKENSAKIKEAFEIDG